MYKITIENIEEVETTKQSWQQIADSGNEKDGGAIYAYVPKPQREEVKTVIYEQVFDDDEIDLIEIIKAANNVI